MRWGRSIQFSFNGDTLSFNGDAMSFNGDTLERFNADDLMKDFKDFNGDLVKFNGDTLAKFNGDLLFNDGPRAFNGDTLAFNGDLHEWKGKGRRLLQPDAFTGDTGLWGAGARAA